MKPPAHSPSPTTMSDMADAELLQAIRDMPQPEPEAALDAAILDAAAKCAAEVRKARAGVSFSTSPTVLKTRKNRSVFDRFSRWLFGDGETRGHLGQMVAAGVFMGVVLGFVLQANRENVFSPALSDKDIAMMKPAPSITTPEETPERMMPSGEGKIPEMELQRPTSAAPPPMPATLAPVQVEKREVAAAPVAALEVASSARTSSAPEASAKTGIAEETQLAVASPLPQEVLQKPMSAPAASPMLAMSDSASVLADGVGAEEATASATIPAAAPETLAAASSSRVAAPFPARSAARGDLTKEKEAEIDAQLKRVLDLRRAGKKEEAQLLLRQLRARYPDTDIDERLRRRESEKNSEENKEGKK
ncbi:MAG: hypothetical protein LBI16_06075 [Burkholderiales bacterium]|jgi:hypothetical protein|nr:hypothetical protein [Burkholderiales bacterium]